MQKIAAAAFDGTDYAVPIVTGLDEDESQAAMGLVKSLWSQYGDDMLDFLLSVGMLSHLCEFDDNLVKFAVKAEKCGKIGSQLRVKLRQLAKKNGYFADPLLSGTILYSQSSDKLAIWQIALLMAMFASMTENKELAESVASDLPVLARETEGAFFEKYSSLIPLIRSYNALDEYSAAMHVMVAAFEQIRKKLAESPEITTFRGAETLTRTLLRSWFKWRKAAINRIMRIKRIMPSGMSGSLGELISKIDAIKAADLGVWLESGNQDILQQLLADTAAEMAPAGISAKKLCGFLSMIVPPLSQNDMAVALAEIEALASGELDPESSFLLKIIIPAIKGESGIEIEPDAIDAECLYSVSLFSRLRKGAYTIKESSGEEEKHEEKDADVSETPETCAGTSKTADGCGSSDTETDTGERTDLSGSDTEDSAEHEGISKDINLKEAPNLPPFSLTVDPGAALSDTDYADAPAPSADSARDGGAAESGNIAAATLPGETAFKDQDAPENTHPDEFRLGVQEETPSSAECVQDVPGDMPEVADSGNGATGGGDSGANLSSDAEGNGEDPPSPEDPFSVSLEEQQSACPPENADSERTESDSPETAESETVPDRNFDANPGTAEVAAATPVYGKSIQEQIDRYFKMHSRIHSWNERLTGNELAMLGNVGGLARLCAGNRERHVQRHAHSEGLDSDEDSCHRELAARASNALLDADEYAGLAFLATEAGPAAVISGDMAVLLHYGLHDPSSPEILRRLKDINAENRASAIIMLAALTLPALFRPKKEYAAKLWAVLPLVQNGLSRFASFLANFAAEEKPLESSSRTRSDLREKTAGFLERLEKAGLPYVPAEKVMRMLFGKTGELSAELRKFLAGDTRKARELAMEYGDRRYHDDIIDRRLPGLSECVAVARQRLLAELDACADLFTEWASLPEDDGLGSVKDAISDIDRGKLSETAAGRALLRRIDLVMGTFTPDGAACEAPHLWGLRVSGLVAPAGGIRLAGLCEAVCSGEWNNPGKVASSLCAVALSGSYEAVGRFLEAHPEYTRIEAERGLVAGYYGYAPSMTPADAVAKMGSAWSDLADKVFCAVSRGCADAFIEAPSDPVMRILARKISLDAFYPCRERITRLICAYPVRASSGAAKSGNPEEDEEFIVSIGTRIGHTESAVNAIPQDADSVIWRRAQITGAGREKRIEELLAMIFPRLGINLLEREGADWIDGRPSFWNASRRLCRPNSALPPPWNGMLQTVITGSGEFSEDSWRRLASGGFIKAGDAVTVIFTTALSGAQRRFLSSLDWPTPYLLIDGSVFLALSVSGWKENVFALGLSGNYPIASYADRNDFGKSCLRIMAQTGRAFDSAGTAVRLLHMLSRMPVEEGAAIMAKMERIWSDAEVIDRDVLLDAVFTSMPKEQPEIEAISCVLDFADGEGMTVDDLARELAACVPGIPDIGDPEKLSRLLESMAAADIVEKCASGKWRLAGDIRWLTGEDPLAALDRLAAGVRS